MYTQPTLLVLWFNGQTTQKTHKHVRKFYRNYTEI